MSEHVTNYLHSSHCSLRESMEKTVIRITTMTAKELGHCVKQK